MAGSRANGSRDQRAFAGSDCIVGDRRGDCRPRAPLALTRSKVPTTMRRASALARKKKELVVRERREPRSGVEKPFARPKDWGDDRRGRLANAHNKSNGNEAHAIGLEQS